MLKGSLVHLRPIQKGDIDLLNQWKNDEDICTYLGGGFRPISKDQQEKWLDNMIDLTGNDRRFIVETLDGLAVGMVGLYGIDWINRNCEIGAYLGDADIRGKGYASEACHLLEEYAFLVLNLRKIKLKVVAENEKAVRMWKRLGYSQVGEYVEERYINGRYCNVKLMEKIVRGGVQPDLVRFPCLMESAVKAA